MASTAYEEWAGVRQARLAALYRASAAARAPDVAEQLAWAAVLRLAAEFQGFVRDLHDNTADALVDHLGGPPEVAQAVRAAVTSQRRLETGNATREAITHDFGRFRLHVVDRVVTRHPGSARWLDTLRVVQLTRNGIAHAQPTKVAAAIGPDPLLIEQVRHWHATLRELAAALDAETRNEVARLTGGDPPWEP